MFLLKKLMKTFRSHFHCLNVSPWLPVVSPRVLSRRSVPLMKKLLLLSGLLSSELLSLWLFVCCVEKIINGHNWMLLNFSSEIDVSLSSTTPLSGHYWSWSCRHNETPGLRSQQKLLKLPSMFKKIMQHIALISLYSCMWDSSTEVLILSIGPVDGRLDPLSMLLFGLWSRKKWVPTRFLTCFLNWNRTRILPIKIKQRGAHHVYSNASIRTTTTKCK